MVSFTHTHTHTHTIENLQITVVVQVCCNSISTMVFIIIIIPRQTESNSTQRILYARVSASFCTRLHIEIPFFGLFFFSSKKSIEISHSSYCMDIIQAPLTYLGANFWAKTVFRAIRVRAVPYSLKYSTIAWMLWSSVQSWYHTY